MTPGVAANVREVISSSLRSWIIESLEHFGVDSRVFLHVIESILEQDVRSLRGEDVLDNLWRGRLVTSMGSRKGRDPKRQMNDDDMRRRVLLENMRACFKEDEFDVAEEFVDELLHRWTEEAQTNVEANRGTKKSSQDLHEEMDDEDNKETKDPVREYNEAFPALGSSPRSSPADHTELASEAARRQNGNCVELLKELFYLNASSRNAESDLPTDSSVRGSVDRAKCCREVAKSMARDFVNSNTQHDYSSDEPLGRRSNVVPDFSSRFFPNRLRGANSTDHYAGIGSELASEDSRSTLSVPSSQVRSVHEPNSRSGEMSNDTCPTPVGEGSKFFPPLPPGVLSRTVEMILSQGLRKIPCCHVPPAGDSYAGASCRCIQCSGIGGMDSFPIYTENEFGMLIRLGEDCSRVVDEGTNRKGYGRGVVDASHLVGVGKNAFPVSSNTLSAGVMEKIAEDVVDQPLSGRIHSPVLGDGGSSEIRQGHQCQLQHRRPAGSGLKGETVGFSSLHQQTEQERDKEFGRRSDHSASLGPNLFFCRLSQDPVTRKDRLESELALHSPIRSQIVGPAIAAQSKPSERNDFQCFGEIDEMSGRRCRTASSDDLQLADALLANRNHTVTTSVNVEPSSSTTVSHRPGQNAGAFASRGSRDRDSTSVTSYELVLRLLADVIERDLMNHIASSLIPLFPDLSAPQSLFLPDAEILAHIAVQNCIPHKPNCPATVGSDAFRAGTRENDYMLYLRLAVRQENLDVDHVLNFEDFCRWQQCLLEQVGSGRNVSCTCDMCHRALKRPVDSRYAFVDVNAATSEEGCQPLIDSERALESRSLLVAKSEHQELQSGKQGRGSHFSSTPASVVNVCLQNSSAAGTGDFTGRFDGISTNNKLPSGKDGNYGCGSVGEGDVLLRSYSPPPTDVFSRSSLREIWPDGDADRKSKEGRSGLKEHFEENNNVLESFGWIPESGFSWPSSQGVAVGNSVNIWHDSGPSPSAAPCRKAISSRKFCDKTDLAGDKSISAAFGYNTAAGNSFAANFCDKVRSADTICNKSSSTVCDKPSLPASACDQSALITNSCDESFSTASSCHNWLCTDVTEATSSVVPSESKPERLSPQSMQTLEKLLSSDEESSSSSVESFRSALHEDFYSMWLNTSGLTHGRGSGLLCAGETSSDAGSLSLGSDEDALHNSDAHYEADISSSDSSLDEGSSSGGRVPHTRSTDARKNRAGKKNLLFGLSFPFEPSSPVGSEDIVRRKHSRFESSQSSVDSSETTDDASESDVSKPYSAACNSSSAERLASAEKCKGLLSDWDRTRPNLEIDEEPVVEHFQTDSEDLEEPTLYRNWEERSTENFGRIIPAWDANLPDLGNVTGLAFSCGQQEEVDLEKYEKLKFIWDESQEFKDSTADCKRQESGSVNFKETSLSKTFSQLNVEDAAESQLPVCGLERSENYPKLWDTDQVKVESFSGSVTAGVWEKSDLEGSMVRAPNWNQHAPEFEHGRSCMTPVWNMNEENSSVLKLNWNEMGPHSIDEGGDAGILNWSIIHHQQSAGSGVDLTSCWDQQTNMGDSLKGPTLNCETARSGSETLEKLTSSHEMVGSQKLESIWVGEKKSVRGVNRRVNEIQEENSVPPLVLDSGRLQESDSANLKNLSSLKSIWEEKELCPESSNGLKAVWDVKDCAVGLASVHQMTDLGSCKDLTDLKSIWEEKGSCLAGSKGVKRNWDMSQMGTILRNAQEVQQTWEAENLEGTALNCKEEEEADSRNVEKLEELRYIWEDTPTESDDLNAMTAYCQPDSAKVKKFIPSSDNNHLKTGNMLGSTGNECLTAQFESSVDVGFFWDIEQKNDETPHGPTSKWDEQQEEERRVVNTVATGSGSLRAMGDMDNCLLLTSIWEKRQSSDSGRNSCWDDVPEIRSREGNAVEMIIPPTCDKANRGVVAELSRNNVNDDFQNLTQSLQRAKRKNLESLMEAIWDMNPGDGEKGVGLTYNCDSQDDDDAETLQNLGQMESLWEDGESIGENLRDWDVELSEGKNSGVQLAPGQDQVDAGQDSFHNLKSIWDEKPPDAETSKGQVLDWDADKSETTGLASDHHIQQEGDAGNFQHLKSIWEENLLDLEDSKGETWDLNRMEEQHAAMIPSCPSQLETDPRIFLNLSEVKSIWEGKKSSSESLDKMASCWENQAPELENTAWDAMNQQDSENLMMLNSSVGQHENDGRNLKSIWEEQQLGGRGDLKGQTSCWKQQGVESKVLNAVSSNWSVTRLNSESFDNSLFDLNCRKLESENIESVMSSHGDMKQSNSEVFLDRSLTDERFFRRPMSDRDLRYQEVGGLTTSNVDLWQSDSDELKQMISRWDKQQQTESRRRGLFSHQTVNLEAEWQLAEAANQLKTTEDGSGSLWRFTGRNNEDGVLPKLVPSENSAFQDEIPRRFVYRYAFFDPRETSGCDPATRDVRTETIRHIYEPSNSIVRQLEDLFDDGQRLNTDEALANRPNCLFRPIGEQNFGCDSRQSVAASAGLAQDIGDLSLQIKSPSSDPLEVVEPDSPYQLYLGVESQAFVPRFRVHKELEKSAQTGEATPPMMQNNECVFGMNVILSTIALLE